MCVTEANMKQVSKLMQVEQFKSEKYKNLHLKVIISDNEIRIEQGEHWVQIQPNQWKAMKALLMATDINEWDLT